MHTKNTGTSQQSSYPSAQPKRAKNILSVFRINAPVVLGFALLSLAALILGAVTGGGTTRLFFSVTRSSLRDPLTYVRLVGHVLGHSSFAHFFSNMSLLLLLGPIAEEKYGSRNLLVSIILTAVVSGALHCLFSADTALLGASGVVFMLIMLSGFTNVKSGTIPLTLVLVVLIYFGQEVWNGVVQKDNISQLTHIVGGLCGIACGIVLNRLPQKKKENRP